jgi:PEP-CTERM motif
MVSFKKVLSRFIFHANRDALNMKKIATLVFALAATIASPALAGTTIFTGDTTAGPVFNRPLAGRPPTGLSAVGTAVRFVVTPFTVTASGNYNFLNSSPRDSFLGVYRNAFNPLAPLVNALAYDDDSGPGSDSQITGLALLTGVSYFAISTGFANTDFGRFTLTIDGPGNIIGAGGAIPEPSTWAMLIFGFGAIGAALRRRKTASAVATA